MLWRALVFFVCVSLVSSLLLIEEALCSLGATKTGLLPRYLSDAGLARTDSAVFAFLPEKKHYVLCNSEDD